ncbi:cell division protein FtsQ/DivIB [Actinomarinicola tropica]|uniref:FtsQ-type POTRA domain-containing protein n=1 Tax=Actinomarinicola tropica TaxID=2789776 RepID=A0A5Q2RIB2_9ACTN|nr:FtsQ-type POTRA domain-containing protein [Actinomarinicola tropica]QGG95543.1 FtsQ-type POTRA domain-containing protein [Actinomarinicola tropica]
MSGSVLERPPSPPGIDARIRARRIEVRRSEGRRRLRKLIVLVVLTLVVAAAWAATRSPLLDVDEVVVRGAARSGEAAVTEATGIVRGETLTDLDLDAARTRVAALPWVAEATVHRSWGGTVSVEVVERVPVAVVAGADGRSWLVDREAVVLDEASATDVVAGHVVVEGASPAAVGGRVEDLPAHVIDLVTALDGEVRSATAAVVLDEGETWIRLHPRPGEVDAEGAARTDGGHIRFGDLRAVDEQVLAASTILSQVALDDLDVVDVRVPSNPVVTRVEHTEDDQDGEATG